MGEPASGSRACTGSSPTRTAPQAGSCSRPARCPTARPPPTCRSSTCSRAYFQIEERDDAARSARRSPASSSTLDETLGRRCPPLLALLDVPGRATQRGRTLDPPQRRQRTLEAVKRLLLRESQVQPLLLRLRGPALDRRRDAGPARQPGREPADRARPAAGQLPARVPARLGQQDLLHATPARPAAAPRAPRRCCDGLLGDDAALAAAQATADRADRGQSLLPRGERPHPGRDRGARRRARGLSSGQAARRDHRCRPRCRRCWPRASTGCRPRTSTCSSPPPSSARTCLLRSWRRSPRMPDDELRRGLAHLQAAEFLYETSLFPEPEYTFKHALTLEVAYQSLLHERRRTLHARVLDALERRLCRSRGREAWSCWPIMRCAARPGSQRPGISIRPARRPWPRAGLGRRATSSRRPWTLSITSARPPTSAGARRVARVWVTKITTSQVEGLQEVGEKAEALARALNDGPRLARVQVRQAQALALMWLIPGTLRVRHRAGPRGVRPRRPGGPPNAELRPIHRGRVVPRSRPGRTTPSPSSAGGSRSFRRPGRSGRTPACPSHLREPLRLALGGLRGLGRVRRGVGLGHRGPSDGRARSATLRA